MNSLVEDETELYGDFCSCDMPDCSICGDDYGDDDFDLTNIEHLCGQCLRNEAIMSGLCGMCSELYPHLI